MAQIKKMNYSPTIISIIENIILMLPALLVVAYVTVAERKTMASMQRRLGPNAVGYYGLLQAFADALKLILKEYVAPTQANLILFFLGSLRSTAQLISYELVLSSVLLIIIMITNSLNLNINVQFQKIV